MSEQYNLIPSLVKKKLHFKLLTNPHKYEKIFHCTRLLGVRKIVRYLDLPCDLCDNVIKNMPWMLNFLHRIDR